MNWEAIEAIREIVGAFAVLATLMYLSIQIRDNTKAVKSENVHRVTDSFNALNLLVASAVFMLMTVTEVADAT